MGFQLNPLTGKFDLVIPLPTGRAINVNRNIGYPTIQEGIDDLGAYEALVILPLNDNTEDLDFTGSNITNATITAYGSSATLLVRVGQLTLDNTCSNIDFRGLDFFGSGQPAYVDTGSNNCTFLECRFDKTASSSVVTTSGAVTTGMTFKSCRFPSGAIDIGHTGGFPRFDYCEEITTIEVNSSAGAFINYCKITASLEHSAGFLLVTNSTPNVIISTATAASGANLFLFNITVGTITAQAITKTGDCNFSFSNVTYNKLTSTVLGTNISSPNYNLDTVNLTVQRQAKFYDIDAITGFIESRSANEDLGWFFESSTQQGFVGIDQSQNGMSVYFGQPSSGAGFVLTGLGSVFNPLFLDLNYIIRKLTSGEAYRYDTGLDKHLFSGEIESEDEATVKDIPVHKSIGNMITTGVYDGGGEVSINVDTTKFDIVDGEGVIIDQSDAANPIYTGVSWSGLTAVSVDNPSAIVTFVYIDINGDVQQQNTTLTRNDYRTKILLAVVATVDTVNVTSITDISHNPSSSYLASDMFNAIGQINISGNGFTNAGTNLELDKASGVTARENINRELDPDNPHRFTSPTSLSTTFNYIYSDGAGGFTLILNQTDIDPDNYDDGSGTLQSVSGFSNIVCYFIPGSEVSILQYGEKDYGSLEEAVADISVMTVTSLAGLLPANIRTIISIKKDVTDIQDAIDGDEARITQTGKFGFVVSGGGGGGGAAGNIEDSITAETDTGKVLQPDGIGGVEWNDGVGEIKYRKVYIGERNGGTNNKISYGANATNQAMGATIHEAGEIVSIGVSTVNSAVAGAYDIEVNNVVVGAIAHNGFTSVTTLGTPIVLASADFVNIVQTANGGGSNFTVTWEVEHTIAINGALKGDTGADGEDGDPGADGIDGIAQILSGAGAPAGGLGGVGDWYHDTNTPFDNYSKTGVSTWTFQYAAAGTAAYGLNQAKYTSAVATPVTSLTDIVIPFEITVFQDSDFTIDTGVTDAIVTLNTNGRYKFMFQATVNGTQNNYRWECLMSIRINGGTPIPITNDGYIRSTTGANDTKISFEDTRSYTATDTVEIMVQRTNTTVGNATLVPNQIALEVTRMQ